MTAQPPVNSSEPLVSVIVPTYNGEKFISEALESILQQTYRHFEILVVDDGSADSTPDVVAKFGSSVRYFKQANAGQPVARNVGIAQASGELVALLDHDDRWLPFKLERQIPLFRLNPGLGMAHAGIRFFREPDGVTTSEHYPDPKIGFHDILGFETLAVQTMLFPRSVALALGGFDRALAGCDDWDFSIRVAAHYPVRGLSEILAEVRGHPNQAGGRQDRIFRMGMSLMKKHRHIHSHCEECKRAIRRSKKKLHSIYYDYLKTQARARFRERKLIESAAATALAFVHDPAALVRIPTAFARRVSG